MKGLTQISIDCVTFSYSDKVYQTAKSLFTGTES